MEAEWRQKHCHGGLRVAVVTKWRHSGCHSHRPMPAIGHPEEAEGRQKHCPDWRIRFATECIYYMLTIGRPLYIQSANMAVRLPAFCLIWASNFSATLVELFWTHSKLYCDHDIHGDVCTSSVLRPLFDRGYLWASLIQLSLNFVPQI